MREWEANPANPRIYRNYNEYVLMRRYNSGMVPALPNQYATKPAYPTYVPAKPEPPDPQTSIRPRDPPKGGVLPPLEYDHPYTKGVLIEVRGNKEKMGKLCPKSSFPITLGCAYAHERDCTIVIADDDILKAQGLNYQIVLRHEVGHCNNWPNSHAGARPAT